jgi:hypothetical protein
MILGPADKLAELEMIFLRNNPGATRVGDGWDGDWSDEISGGYEITMHCVSKLRGMKEYDMEYFECPPNSTVPRTTVQYTFFAR